MTGSAARHGPQPSETGAQRSVVYDGEFPPPSPPLTPNMSEPPSRYRAVWPWMLLTAMTAFFFAGPFLRNEGLSFRDTATFYLPRYVWAAEQREQTGSIPLWNDRIGLGVPVVADASSASFYPLQAIFHLRLSGARRMLLYVAIHTLLAGAAAFALARQLGCRTSSATVAAIGYAFGGSVLFQYCNVVFLVGAAWLPLSCLCWNRALRQRDLTWSLAWSATLAMMVLGGDPQMAYHAVLIAALAWICGVGNEHADSTSPPIPWWKSLALLGVGVAVAILLAAIQIAPSAEWSRDSTRAMRDDPRSVFELAADTTAGREVSWKQLMDEPEVGHAANTYAFSVGPWRWLEWLWPNATGSMFPENRRWLRAIPAEGRTWSPSLYMSGPVVLLAFLGVGRSRTRRWLAWLAALSLLASLGRYGCGWLISEVEFVTTGAKVNRWGIGDPVGGIYWLLTTFLPGYAFFRYPAKWLTVTSLAVAVLGGLGWQRCEDATSQSRSRIRWGFVGLAAVSGGAAIVVWLSAPVLGPVLEARMRGESFFGPFSGGGACWDFAWGAAHAAMVLAAFGGLLVMPAARLRGILFAGLVATELCFANQGLLATASHEAWSVGGEQQRELTALGSKDELKRIYRGNEVGWLPENWARHAHVDPLGEALHWNVATAFPQLHLLAPDRLAVVNAPTSIEPARWQAWQALARGVGPSRPSGTRDCDPELLSVLGVRGAWVPEAAPWNQGGNDRALSSRESGYRVDNTRAFRMDRFPRAWFVDEVESREPLVDTRRETLYATMREILFPQGRRRDFQSSAVAEANISLRQPHSKHAEDDEPKVDLITDKGSLLEFDVQTQRSRFLVISNQYDAGWQARLHSESHDVALPIVRTNGVMQGVVIPQGRHTLQLYYAPSSVAVASWLTGISWSALLAMVILRLTIRRSGR